MRIDMRIQYKSGLIVRSGGDVHMGAHKSKVLYICISCWLLAYELSDSFQAETKMIVVTS